MSTEQETQEFDPQPGDRVVVRRFIQPTLNDGDPQRIMTVQFSAVLVSKAIRGSCTLYYFDDDTITIDYDADGYHDPCTVKMISDGYVYLRPEYLVTEVVPFAGDQAEPFRVQVSPDMAVVVDASQCIVLEVREPAGPVIRRVTVTDVDHLAAVLNAARKAQHVELVKADIHRLRGREERRRSDGKLTRSEAVDWLISRGYERGRAAGITQRLRELPATDVEQGMRYAAPYWVVPAATDAI